MENQFNLFLGSILLITLFLILLIWNNWSKIKSYFIGENLLLNGFVVEIKEEKELLYFNNDNNSYLHRSDEYLEIPYCLVRVMKKNLTKDIITLKIMESEKKLKEIYKVVLLTKLEADCFKFWWDKNYYLQRIKQVD